MPVFSLEEVRALQVKNISQNNFKYWPESAVYGYFGGGFAPPSINTITRLDFSNETVSDPGKNLPTATSGLAAVSSSSYGYFGGGSNPPTTMICTITRLDFSNETVSNPGKNLPTSRDLLAAVSSSSYGYFGGGFTPPYINTISRLDFSNETVSDPGKNLPSAGGSGGRRSQLAAISNNSYGYFGGGANPAGFNSCTISRLDFSNETATDPGKNLSAPSTFIAAVSNNFYGYFGGGSGVCTINRLDFSNETVSAPGKNLPTIRRGPLAFSSSTATGSLNGSYGYFGGGGVPTGSGITDIIEQLDFATENVNTLTATLGQQVRSGAAVANSGSSFRTNSKTYGYFGGGYTPPYLNTISRLDFSNETVSLPTKNLPTSRANFAAVSNSN